MLGLVSYNSDDEAEEQQEQAQVPQSSQVGAEVFGGTKDGVKNNGRSLLEVPLRGEKQNRLCDKKNPIPTASIISAPAVSANATIAGSPSRPVPPPILSPLPEVPESSVSPAPPTDDIAVAGPAFGPTLPSLGNSPYPSYNSPSPPAAMSPYSLNRSRIHSLTLPHTIPPIPPSPPGTPPLEASSKFSNFLALKRQGVHFNEKLARSSALRNPRLLEKLMGFLGLDVAVGDPETGGKWSADQYVSGLPKGVWDPEAWAGHGEGFVEELRKSQHRILERRQKQMEETARGVPRQSLAFVGEKGSEFGAGRKEAGKEGPTSERGARGGISAAERVMAGLDRSERGTPPARGENGRRGCKDGYDRDNDRDRDRDRRDRGMVGDDYYRSRERGQERERDKERDRRKTNRSRSRSRSRDREKYKR